MESVTLPKKVSKSQQNISTFFEVQAHMTWFDRK